MAHKYTPVYKYIRDPSKIDEYFSEKSKSLTTLTRGKTRGSVKFIRINDERLYEEIRLMAKNDERSINNFVMLLIREGVKSRRENINE